MFKRFTGILNSFFQKYLSFLRITAIFVFYSRLNVIVLERYFSPARRFDWIFKFTSMKKELDRQLKISNEFTDKVGFFIKLYAIGNF
jgi:hypothetical protein